MHRKGKTIAAGVVVAPAKIKKLGSKADPLSEMVQESVSHVAGWLPAPGMVCQPVWVAQRAQIAIARR